MNDDGKMDADDLFPPSTVPTSTAIPSTLVLHPRRETFEHGLLPTPKLIFTDGTLTLTSIKHKLLSVSTSMRIASPDLSKALQIPIEQAELVIETLAPTRSCFRGHTRIQLRLRKSGLLHRFSMGSCPLYRHCSLSAATVVVLCHHKLMKKSNSPSFCAMANLLILLAESVEGYGDESMFLSLERFEHLGLLIQLGENGCENNQLRQAAPFFANSDPDMPAAPVLKTQVHDWILQYISASLQHTAEKALTKDNDSQAVGDDDVFMADACSNHMKVRSGPSPLTVLEGISKFSVLKKECDIQGSTIKILNCHETVIYILAPLRYANVYGCSDVTIVLGAIGKAIQVEHCERAQIIAAAKRICIANFQECTFYLGVNQRPLILGDNHKLQVASYNTFYIQLNEHLRRVSLDATINRWNKPLVLGMVDPHDSLSHHAGISDIQAESPTCLDLDLFKNFLIPNWDGIESTQPTKENPFALPEDYMASLRKQWLAVKEIQQSIKDAQLDEIKRKELATVIHTQFKDWLYATGNIRRLYCVQGD